MYLKKSKNEPLMRIMGLDVGSKDRRGYCGDPLGLAQGLKNRKIDEDKRIRFDALAELIGSIQGRPFCCGLAEKHLDEHQRTAWKPVRPMAQ